MVKFVQKLWEAGRRVAAGFVAMSHRMRAMAPVRKLWRAPSVLLRIFQKVSVLPRYPARIYEVSGGNSASSEGAAAFTEPRQDRIPYAPHVCHLGRGRSASLADDDSATCVALCDSDELQELCRLLNMLMIKFKARVASFIEPLFLNSCALCCADTRLIR